MACIHYSLDKPNLACFYLYKALEENEKAVKNLQIDDKGIKYLHIDILFIFYSNMIIISNTHVHVYINNVHVTNFLLKK